MTEDSKTPKPKPPASQPAQKAVPRQARKDDAKAPKITDYASI